MKYLTTDFGSTYTKLTAIDTDKGKILGTAASFTTIETDVMEGFNAAKSILTEKIGNFEPDEIVCCSSAAGGLKMVALGLVPELTAKAARTAAASAGAKVVKTYSYEISQREAKEIGEIAPDLILLCGGTDGGNRDVIVENAKQLASIKGHFSTIVAGNKSAADEVSAILARAKKSHVVTDNVMPQFNKLNIESAREEIKELFIRRIVDAKGLGAAQAMSSYEIIPTPLAVLNGCELLSRGTRKTAGIGELMAIDIGGATTDVYSMATGKPTISNVLVKGIPEPFAKRSVEGDLGMRYSLSSLGEEANLELLAEELGVTVETVASWIDRCASDPDTLAEPGSEEQRIEEALARSAVKIAVERHSGVWASAYTPVGEIFTLNGKDLGEVPYVIGIGGVVINSPNPQYILEGAKAELGAFEFAKPKNPKYLLDRRYIFAAMGLLSGIDPELALKLMKEEICSN